MLINLQEMLRLAEETNCAIGSFNVYNAESVQAVLKAADGSHPIILAFGEKYDEHMPLEAMAALVKSYVAETTQPVVLHLDHTKKEQTILRAIRAGFTSVMFDGSLRPLEENIYATAQITHMAHLVSVSVEGELGYLNEEDGTGDPGDPASYTTSEEAQAFISGTHVDALAISIGNAHGLYKGTPHLDLDRLSEIRKAVDTPLVLHGSSGIPKETLQEAIRRGIRKININTEVSTKGVQSARDFLVTHEDPNLRFEAVTKNAELAMTEVVRNYIDWFDLK